MNRITKYCWYAAFLALCACTSRVASAQQNNKQVVNASQTAESQLPKLDGILKTLTEMEVRQRNASHQLIVESSYAIPQLQGKVSRKILTSASQVLDALAGANKTLQLTRWSIKDARFAAENARFSSSGKRLSYLNLTYDGHEYRDFNSDSQFAEEDLVPTQAQGIGLIDEEKHGSPEVLLGALLRQNQADLVEKTTINDFLAYKVREKTIRAATPQHLAWLAPERSYQAVRIDVVTPVNETEFKTYHTRTEVLNFIQFRGIWIPRNWVKLSWTVNRQNKIVWGGLDSYELAQIKPLESEQKSIYSLDFPIGVFVMDSSRNKAYVEGVDFMPYLKTLNEKTLPKEVQDFVTRVVTEETAENVATQTQAINSPK